MEIVKSRKILFTVATIVLVSYCLVLNRLFKKRPTPTGTPVDWRNVPPLPPFARQPLPANSDRSRAIDDWPARSTNGNAASRPASNKPSIIVDKRSTRRSRADLYRDLTIVTAFSENHFLEALGLIGTVQRTMPDKRLVIYDLGIEPETLVKVKKLCNIELRRFPFENYPPHVKNLHTYAWKVIIINITLHEFGAIFWGDASVRFKDSLQHLVPYIMHHQGYMAHFHSFDALGATDTRLGHIAYFTSPKMYAALGIKRAQYIAARNATPFATANRQLFVKNSYLMEKLVDPLLQCALHPECISPVGARLGKHRFDASALSLLIYKNMPYEWAAENNDNNIFDEVIDIRRTTMDRHLAKFC